MEHRR